MITFGQTARCDTVDELSLAAAAGVTSVVCEPDLAGGALDLGLVPLRASERDGEGVPHTAYTIQPNGERSAAAVEAAVALALDDASPLSDYPLVTVLGDDASTVGAAIGRLRALLPAARIGAEAADSDVAAALIEAGADWSSSGGRSWRCSARAFPVRNGPRCSKAEFQLDWERREMRCPNDVVLPFAPGAKVQFPAEVCGRCPLRQQCTTSREGRSVQVHPTSGCSSNCVPVRQQTPEGRARLRERVAVEHSLSHVGRWQGRRARYRGQRKNLHDLRRTAVVHNLHVIARPAKAARQTT